MIWVYTVWKKTNLFVVWSDYVFLIKQQNKTIHKTTIYRSCGLKQAQMTSYTGSHKLACWLQNIFELTRVRQDTYLNKKHKSEKICNSH